MSNPFQSAIDALEKELAPIERQRNELLTTINVLRAKANLPPRPDTPSPGGGGGQSGEAPAATLTTLKNDTFFGKRMGTAAREYLEMRYAAANGTDPATTRQIFDALKAGGFVFETRDDGVAMISLRNMLRKASQTFLKLPNGTYGLRSWYPGARKPKNSASGDGADDVDGEFQETEATTTKKVAVAS